MRADGLRCCGFHEVELQEDRARDGIHGLDIDPDNISFATAFNEHLGPAARRCAQVDSRAALPEEAELVVHFSQLVGRPRTIAFGLRGPHIGIIELTFQPGARRLRSVFAGLKAFLQRPRRDRL